MSSRRAWVLACLLASVVQIAATQSLLRKARSLADPRTNPYAGDETARRAGRKLFRRECSGCHGQEGKGNGRRRTPALATPQVEQADPGTLFWILRNGSGDHAMPSFSHLPEAQRWQIITYVKSLSVE
jgi:mono/diheme cytochrome c family protein